jgi:hypothetical protein
LRKEKKILSLSLRLTTNPENKKRLQRAKDQYSALRKRLEKGLGNFSSEFPKALQKPGASGIPMKKDVLRALADE